MDSRDLENISPPVMPGTPPGRDCRQFDRRRTLLMTPDQPAPILITTTT